MSKYLLSVFTVLVVAGCSNEQLYKAGQDYQRSQCLADASSGQHRSDCVNSEDISFKEYSRERSDSIH
ncbi:hypothetical protein ACXJY6_07760 [Vibrio sp. RC27]